MKQENPESAAPAAEGDAEKMAGLVEELDTLKEQFKVIDSKRVTESCGSHGADVAVFYVGDECPLCTAIAAPVPSALRSAPRIDERRRALLWMCPYRGKGLGQSLGWRRIRD